MPPVLRIIDANANRAREALRVMEDAARFVLDDESLSRACKDLRHDLRRVFDSLPADGSALLAWRDTPNDVGTTIGTASEGERAGAADVAAAAGKRLTEALRSIEEYAKTLSQGAGAAREVETLRYRSYDLERRLILALGARTGGTCDATPAWRLCVLISADLCARPWTDVLRAALAAGADCVQLREKSMDAGPLLDAAREAVEIARRESPGAAVVVNDRPDIALLAGASGVHLGQTDLQPADVRRLAGRSLLVGVSTANLEQARAALAAGADYSGCGPMFETTTKHKPTIAGPSYLRDYLDRFGARTPCLAIGGVCPDNAASLADAARGSPNAHRFGLAASSAVCRDDEPGAVCRRLLEPIDRLRDEHAAAGTVTAHQSAEGSA